MPYLDLGAAGDLAVRGLPRPGLATRSVVLGVRPDVAGVGASDSALAVRGVCKRAEAKLRIQKPRWSARAPAETMVALNDIGRSCVASEVAMLLRFSQPCNAALLTSSPLARLVTSYTPHQTLVCAA